jgi:hypothetical protein
MPSTCTCSKIAEYSYIQWANPLICCKSTKYPKISILQQYQAIWSKAEGSNVQEGG